MKKLALLFCLSLLIAGCGEEAKKEESPPLVKTLVIGRETTSSAHVYTGKIVSRYETPLSFQVAGEINGRFIDPGAVVHSGDTLMTINTRDTSANVEAAEADVAAKRAEASLAAVNLKRYKELYAADAAPKSALDEMQTRADATRAALEAAEANLIRAKNSNNYTNLVAPMDGVITTVNAEIGQIVAAGSPVATIADPNAFEVETQLPEAQFPHVTEGMPAFAEFYGIEGKFPAVVREISPQANQESRTYRIRLSLSEIPQGLALGRSAKIEYDQKQVNSVIPLSAIDGKGDDTFCWVIEDNKVHKRKVKVRPGENNMAIVELPKGTTIVTAGIHLLTENMEIRRDDAK